MKLPFLFLGLCLGLFAVRPVPVASPDSAYRAALPLYQYDRAQTLAPQSVETKVFPDCRLMRFSYASTNGQRVPALLFVPTAASRAHPVPCLLLLHGLGMNKEWMSGMARTAAAHGYASLVIDEYGQGERALPEAAGPLTPEAVQQQLSTTISQTVVDVRRGLDYLGTRPEIAHARVGLVGVSLGAIIGSVTAGVDSRVKATVLVSGGGDWALILRNLSRQTQSVDGRRIVGAETVDWPQVRARLAPEDPLTFAPHIAPRALLMENGRRDTVIVPQAAEELYEAARATPHARVQIDWYPHAGHVPAPELVYPAVLTWLGRNL